MSLLSRSGQVALEEFYRNTLFQDVLPFWFPRALDEQYGGYFHCFDAAGNCVDSDKSVWAQGRMAWMLLTLFNTCEPRPEWLQWGRSGVEFLFQHAFDTDGRMFFHLTREGEPIRKRRYAYSESFAAIACAAMARATGESIWSERAKELFNHFVSWNFTGGSAPPKFTNTRPMIGLGPRMIAIVTAQTLRADIGDDPVFGSWIDRCLEEVVRWFVRDDLRVVLETVGENGEILDHFDGRTINPGHAIEAAWFVLEEGEYRNDSALIDLGCKMLTYSWERGWDQEYGGLFYFRDVYGHPVQEYWHDMKFWWPHDEAIIATLMAYQLTGQEQFAHWHSLVHDWSFRHFSDPVHGEWFGYLHRDGRISTTLKGNLWKSFFHHPRMLWKCLQRLNDAGFQ